MLSQALASSFGLAGDTGKKEKKQDPKVRYFVQYIARASIRPQNPGL